MAANSAPSATALTTDVEDARAWADKQYTHALHLCGIYGEDRDRRVDAAVEGFIAGRERAHSACRERERRLREYVTHKADCHWWYCRTCDSTVITDRKRHAKIGYGDHQIDRGVCNCGLAELLAAKEGDGDAEEDASK